ncbi:MAG TPA: hypothetical protein VD927_19000 [Chryseosolibacter sp.]|nr:hypothetical protein [Chryseosolibacter sp.]
MKQILFFTLFLSCYIASGQRILGEIELVGFLLGQHRHAVHAELGPPIEKRQTEDKWIYEFHKLTPDTSAYVLFKYPSWDTTRIYAIQISGDRYDHMHPFRGLKLGASLNEVTQVFGKSNDIETITDPPLAVHYFDQKNYSFEIDRSGRLNGIQIFGKILSNPVEKKMATINGFREAVISKNVDSLLHYLSPDVKIIASGKETPFSGAAREEFKKANSPFVQKLLGEMNSVHYAFSKERAEGEGELKTFGEGNNTFTVFKFYDSEIISEILFYPHAGKWKVFQIHFRK